MIRHCFLFLCVSSCLVTICFGDQGLGSDGKVVKDINPLVSGAAALVLVYVPVQSEEVEGFKEVLKIINESCEPLVRRPDGKSEFTPAVIVICIEDEIDVKRWGEIDSQLKNVTIVAPLDHKKFLDGKKLKYSPKIVEVFTEVDVENERLILGTMRSTSLPFPTQRDSRRSKVLEQWKLEFKDLARTAK